MSCRAGVRGVCPARTPARTVRAAGRLVADTSKGWEGDLMSSTTPPVAAEVAEQLRALLAVIDAGEMDATDTERAYLAGAADALDAVAGPR